MKPETPATNQNEVYVYQETYRDHEIYREVTNQEYYTHMDIGRCIADTLGNMRELIDGNLDYGLKQ